MTFCCKKYFHCIANIFSSLSGSSPPLPFRNHRFPFYWPIMLLSWYPLLLTVLIFPTGKHKTETKKSKAFLEAKRHWEKNGHPFSVLMHIKDLNWELLPSMFYNHKEKSSSAQLKTGASTAPHACIWYIPLEVWRRQHIVWARGSVLLLQASTNNMQYKGKQGKLCFQTTDLKAVK